MQRLPVLMIANVQLGTTVIAGASYTTPGTAAASVNTPQPYTTINSFNLNNTTATPRTVTVHKIPPAGTAAPANEIVSTISVPATGSPPTVVNLTGSHLPAGWTLALTADAATAVTADVSGYLTTP